MRVGLALAMVLATGLGACEHLNAAVVSDQRLIEIARGGQPANDDKVFVKRGRKVSSVEFEPNCTNCVGGGGTVFIDMRTLRVTHMVVFQ